MYRNTQIKILRENICGWSEIIDIRMPIKLNCLTYLLRSRIKGKNVPIEKYIDKAIYQTITIITITIHQCDDKLICFVIVSYSSSHNNDNDNKITLAYISQSFSSVRLTLSLCCALFIYDFRIAHNLCWYIILDTFKQQ